MLSLAPDGSRCEKEDQTMARNSVSARPGNPAWFGSKFLRSLLVALVLVAGVGVAVQPWKTLDANAAVDDGSGFTFPADLEPMVNYWTARNWPTNRSTIQEQVNGNNGFIYHGGGYRDRDGQLTAYIQANFPGAVAPTFAEYDIDFRPARNTRRNARRIVRDFANGHIFYTDDHYANFHLVVFQNLPDVDDATPSIPPADPPVFESEAPNNEEIEGDPEGGVAQFQSPDPTVFLPIEDPDKEVEWNDPLGQADERGDTFFGTLASTFGAILLAIAFFKG
jgi:hypothetical protein